MSDFFHSGWSIFVAAGGGAKVTLSAGVAAIDSGAGASIVLMGNTPCQALLGQKGITALRGSWAKVLGKPCLPMFHPAYLLRNPAAKREAWADLLTLNARLKT